MVLSRSSALAEPMLSPEDEARHIQAWKHDRNVASRDAVVRAYARLCYRIASQYSANPDHIEDLAQEGSFGILRAMEKYDPSRGVKFSTYSRYWVQNFVAAAAAGVVNVISVPSRAYIDAKMGRLAPGKNDAAVAASQPFVALDATVGDSGGESVVDRLACPKPGPDLIVEGESAQDFFKLSINEAMSCLTEREKAVVLARRLTDPPLTLEEISESYGVTRERIRQIEMGAMQKLAAALKRNGFDPSEHFRD